MDGNAVVVGAGIAGLTAARVLGDRYARVTLLDRDELPDRVVPRRGVPQGIQPHILLAAGLRQLDTLFPGFEDKLIAAGGTRFDTGTGLCTFRLGRRWPSAPTGIELVSATRPLIESLVRDRVAALPGVVIRDRVAVSGLAGSADGVTGVVLDTGETLPADLVVDCTGRGARSDRWLTALGLPAPAQEEVKAGVTYSSRFYRRRPGDLPDWQAVFVLPTAPGERIDGIAVPVEGDRWLIGIGGWHFPEVPTDAESFERYARELPDPILAELLSRVEPLSDPVVARFPSSRRRLFERMDSPPPGYVALGDAVCSVNPIYGQGMTCAALSAGALGVALDNHRRRAGTAMVRDYYAAVARIVATPWQFAVGGDFAYPQTVGPRPRGMKLRHWYSRRIAYASQIDSGVNRVYMRVQQLLDPPSVLTRPAFAVRVLRMARKRRRGSGPLR
ncbi:FAD-dependent oxidoreductase [Actinoplanes sp. URMC 104]|uniref:FAD-dependent oxidoreductase n=1 Tax=Actinoplanes sp. URMC 104 TaxID=3423409 RepID=UPI003F1B085A